MKQSLFSPPLIILLLLSVLSACENKVPSSEADQANRPPTGQPSASLEQALSSAPKPPPVTENKAPTELEWDDLVPADQQLDSLMEEYDIDNLSDDDPRAAELMEQLKEFWKQAPVVEELNGKYVKLPGFVVPVETDGKSISEFLLVPYFGACIHVPPPPANQTVHIVTEPTKPYEGKLFDTVWITGTLKVESTSNDLGDAGYRIDAKLVEPYE